LEWVKRERDKAVADRQAMFDSNAEAVRQLQVAVKARNERIDRLVAEVAEVRCERDALAKQLAATGLVGELEKLRQRSEDETRELGFGPRALAGLWQMNPPEAFDRRQAEAAVVDALVHEGVSAHSGDAVGIVASMLEALHSRWQTEKVVGHALSAEVDKAMKAIGYGVDDGRWTPGTSAVDALIAERDVLQAKLEQLTRDVERVVIGGTTDPIEALRVALETVDAGQALAGAPIPADSNSIPGDSSAPGTAAETACDHGPDAAWACPACREPTRG